MLTCEKFGRQDETVDEILDPYASEICDVEDVVATLCDECYHNDIDLQNWLEERANDI